jgi:hypothetical protein
MGLIWLDANWYAVYSHPYVRLRVQEKSSTTHLLTLERERRLLQLSLHN